MVSSVNVDQPTMALTEFFPLGGIYPERSDGSVSDSASDGGGLPLGVVRIFAGNFVPGNSDGATGELLSIPQYASLYSFLGTVYGGDGVQTFALPNLGARESIGAGSGAGLYTTVLGEEQGSDTVTLTHANLQGVPIPTTQPSTTLEYLIDSGGAYNASDSVDFAGEVVQYAGGFVPIGFLAADGQTLNISDYPQLFAAIGTTYGGDGVTTFKLPDLQGRTIVGGTTSGIVSGADSVTVTKAELPVADGGSGAAVPVGTPTVSMEYLIALEGIFPSRGGGGDPDSTNPYVGEVVAYAGGAIPRGWALANGQTLPIQQNAALFALIGTTYGGNGTTTFDLPNLVGKSIVGTDSSLASGTTAGAASVTLTTAEVPGPTLSGLILKAIAAGAPTSIASGATVTSATGLLASIKVSIAGFVVGDVLSATIAGTSISASYNSVTGVLTLSGTDTAAHYQQVVDSITLTPGAMTAATYPSATRTISYAVYDGAITYTTSSQVVVNSGAFADTAANVSSKFDALNGNPNITSITITDGQPLTLTQTQYNTDTRALGLVGGGAHTVDETGITGQSYVSRALSYDASDRISSSTLYNGSGAVVGSSSFVYGSGSAYTVTINVTGTDYATQIVSYDTSGNLASSEYDGYTDKAYTSLKTSYVGGVLHDKLLSGFTSGPYASMDIAYDSSGRNSVVTTYDSSHNALTTASYSYGTGGAYTVTTTFASGPYTSQAVSYSGSGQITSNDFYGYTGQAYTHIHFDYVAGTASLETFFNTDGSHLVQALTTGVAITDTAVNEAFYLTSGDTFTLSSASFGQDSIRGYTPGAATFDISSSVFSDFSHFIAAAHDDGHGDTLVTYDAGDTLLFVGVTTAQLNAHASDFHFG